MSGTFFYFSSLFLLCLFFAAGFLFFRSKGKRVHAALLVSDSEYKNLEAVFHTITDYVSIISPDLKLIKVNESYRAAAGGNFEDFTGHSCWSKLWAQSGKCEWCPVERVRRTGKALVNSHVTLKRKEELRTYSLSVYPIRDKSGSVVNVIEYVRDITEENSMIEQLIRSEKLASIGIMTAGIAHEMNNPLSGISGTAMNMLQMPQKYGLNDKGVSRISIILENSDRATGIMKDLLRLSRKHDSEKVYVSINELIDRTMNAIHFPGAAEVEKSYNFDPQLPLISCDPGKIEQVIINIMTNAVQSIKEEKERVNALGRAYNGFISISTKKQDEVVLISIADNGKGIPREIKNKVYDPFFTTRAPGQGTGLGLSICYRIVEEHGGKLFFDSFDGMTTFYVALPCNADGFVETSVLELLNV
ncbi:ATP-binding protein [Chitinispirillales bacterium ANBcel5]|uniref:two-component system sensor histidine kinase NtrB n=1 Tax=Cellulosispirillum alkaliphilum TaxID=3039283 RepID=UPI002A4E3057|nr:ATP-binding protein [Chitinispirillales bacterium ANBcel5]